MDNLIRAIITELHEAASKFSAGQSLESAMQEYRQELALSMLEYLESDRPITAFRNLYKRATNDAFNAALSAGWRDGKGQGQIPEHVVAWNNGQIDSQMGYIDGVFQELKALRKEGDKDKWGAYVAARADGYSGSLTGIYARAKMEAGKGKIGVWRVGPTDHCTTCAGLDNQVRTIKEFIERGLIPQQKGSPTLECGGWNCQCGIYDLTTGKRLIP